MVKSEKEEKIERNLTNLASKILTDKVSCVGFQTKFIFNMMKMAHKKGWDFLPVEKQYWEEHS